jgi:signal transduction histidine kinase
VFEPFFTQGKKEGLGLGLFISKRIIENHNGIIYSESEVDKGAQFVIELPLVSEERIAS